MGNANERLSSIEESNIASNGKYTTRSTINRRYIEHSEGFAQCARVNEISSYIRMIDFFFSFFLFYLSFEKTC
jgi:hypothetical protein